MTTQELDALQALCDGATAGPWEVHGPTPPGSEFYDVATPSGAGIAVTNRKNAPFIAAARTAMPALIGEVRRLRSVPFDLPGWAQRIQDIADTNPATEDQAAVIFQAWAAGWMQYCRPNERVLRAYAKYTASMGAYAKWVREVRDATQPAKEDQ